MATPSNGLVEPLQDQAPTTEAKPRQPKKKNTPICKFYNTKKGCREADHCKFRHEPETQMLQQSSVDGSASTSQTSDRLEKRTVPTAAPSKSPRVVPRPIPKALTDDPRKFQIGQVERRFKADRSERDDDTVLTFRMEPSDPDFPYEIEALECELSVPLSYPLSSTSTLVIRNKDIPRGFGINIEKGFDTLCVSAPKLTLLGLMNQLDKQLETILSGRKAETVKIVTQRHQHDTGVSISPAAILSPQQGPESANGSRHMHTNQQLEDATSKRQSDIRQLEARFRKLELFSKSSDGFTYTVPLDSPKRSMWPTELQALKVARITVPDMYPLRPAELRLEGGSKAARNVEDAFKRRSESNSTATITQLINYLSLHLKEMSTAPAEVALHPPASVDRPVQNQAPPPEVVAHFGTHASDDDRSHIKHIPRPPEWSTQQDINESSDDDSEETSDSEVEESDETEDRNAPTEQTQTTSQAPVERGILLSFPHLELHGVELLELTSLHISVRCERCKEITDVERLRSSSENSSMRELSCKKCVAGLAVRFRADVIHANSARAGYLDVEGCAVVDMLPSNFIPTCSECSTAFPAPGVVAVRGDTAMALCRECHRKMTIRIQEVKFLQTSAAAIRASRATGQKKPKENLGIVAGTELPHRGRCTHYRKSYRWFRFSCCSKVFACDRCHDETTDHPNEHANRMICGFCSREQNYRPDDCGICQAALTGKAGRGFWEGGKGTRDPAKMSRKDPRKYRNRTKTKPRS